LVDALVLPTVHVATPPSLAEDCLRRLSLCAVSLVNTIMVKGCTNCR